MRGSLVDITRRRKEEEQAQNQQKLQSVGTLAAGVAHEINNPINGIINYAQLVADSSSPDSLPHEYSLEIINESNRVSEIVSNLLSFSRQERPTRSPAVLEDVIHRSVGLVQALLKRDQIRLEIVVPEDLPQVMCRSQQIQQVLINLLTNARDSLNERYEGGDENKIIRISAEIHERNGRKQIRTTVEDRGLGIPAEIQNRILDPFFTTKNRAHGTGLGLAISHGIVEEHEGSLTFETEAESATRFHFELPVA